MAIIYDFQLLADGAAAVGNATSAEVNSPDVNTGEGEREATETKNSPDAEDNKGKGVEITPEVRAKEFEALIKGEYKEQFNGRVQKIIDRRFKGQKEMLEELEATRPVIDMLKQRYKAQDIASLREAIEGDNSYWEKAAYDAGLEVEQFKELTMLRAENERLKAARRETEQQRYIRGQIEEWERQGEELKADYPDFDLGVELSNGDFQGLLKSGIPVKTAYELMHLEEIRETVRRQTEKAVMDNIRANGSRPVENGIKASGGFVLGKNVADLSREERAEIKKRVQRGERIIL